MCLYGHWIKILYDIDIRILIIGQNISLKYIIAQIKIMDEGMVLDNRGDITF